MQIDRGALGHLIRLVARRRGLAEDFVRCGTTPIRRLRLDNGAYLCTRVIVFRIDLLAAVVEGASHKSRNAICRGSEVLVPNDRFRVYVDDSNIGEAASIRHKLELGSIDFNNVAAAETWPLETRHTSSQSAGR